MSSVIRCHLCWEPVAVSLNKKGLAHYYCGSCGIQVQSRKVESSERLLGTYEKGQEVGGAAAKARAEKDLKDADDGFFSLF